MKFYRKIAYFDVDQTIYPGYSTSDFYLFLVTKGLGGEWTITKDKEIGRLYQSGSITYSEAGVRVVQLLAEVIQGRSVQEIMAYARDFVTLKRVKSFVPKLFSLLKRNNFQTTLVSASPEPNVSAIAHYSQADHYHASTYEVIDGRYTGKVLHQLDNDEKRKIILSNIDTRRNPLILAFGDSTGDIPMLSLATHAFVIDPHQVEMIDRTRSQPNWHLVSEQTILDKVRTIIRKS